MFLDKYMPIKSMYKHNKTSTSKEKKTSSPDIHNNGTKKVKRQEKIIKNFDCQKNQVKKRIMTENDEDFQHKMNKTIAQKPRKTNLFLQDSQEYSKEKSNDKFLKRFEKNNYLAVQSTKHNQSKNRQLQNLYGGKIQKKKVSIQKKDKYINPVNIAKLMQKKESNKKSQNKPLQNIYNDSKNRSGNHQKSLSKSKKIETQEKNLNNLDKIKINLQKPNQKKQIKQQNTVQTIKKIKQQYNNFQYLQKFDLTQDQYQTFGDRFPYGFEKIKLLGRGGFSLVWLGQHKKSSKLFAIKQIITKNTHQTHMKQIWFGSIFFTLGGIPKPEFSKHIGIKNLVKMYSYEINQLDTWIFYEKCGSSLGNSLYDIRSDKMNGEKVYKIFYKPLYHQLIKNPNLLKKIIIQVCKALQLLSDNYIVHSDLKTENILIRHQQQQITEVKLIDYGSSFSFTQINQFSMATPQYMSHEILNYILCQNESEYDQQLLKKVKNYKNPWVVDIWSLGCVLLQIINGIPLWMSLPLLIQHKGNYQMKFGLFAVKGRIFQKIIDKQVEVIQNLDYYITKENYSGIKVDKSLTKILKGMLQLQPQLRMSPMKVIQILQQS